MHRLQVGCHQRKVAVAVVVGSLLGGIPSAGMAAAAVGIPNCKRTGCCCSCWRAEPAGPVLHYLPSLIQFCLCVNVKCLPKQYSPFLFGLSLVASSKQRRFQALNGRFFFFFFAISRTLFLF